MAAAALVTLGIALFGVAGSPLELTARADGHQLTLDPSTDVTYGQYVAATLSGYLPGQALAFRQCIAGTQTPDLATQCSAVLPFTAIIDDTGKDTVYPPILPDPEDGSTGDGNMVYASTFDPGKGGCGSDNPCFPCDQDDPCQIAAFTDPFDVSTGVFATAHFGASPIACPTPGQDQAFAHGSGGAPPYRALYLWEGTVCQDPRDLSVQVDLTNSYDGVKAWSSDPQLADFAVTGQPLDAEEKSQVDSSGHTFAYAPISGSGVVLAYEIFDRRGPQVSSLVLTPDLIGQIFTGQLFNWNFSDRLNQLNPGIQWPPQITPYIRAEHAEESLALTTWLTNVVDPSVLKHLDPPWPGPSSVFPLYGGGLIQALTGSNKLALGIRCKICVPPFGTIGFVDASVAAFYGLPTVKIKVANHKPPVAATPDTMEKAIEDALPPKADGSVAFPYDDSDPTAWPIPLVSYILAPTNKIDPSVGAVLDSFISYAAAKGQDSLPDSFQYAKLPPVLATEAIDAADKIPHVPPTTPPPTTTPPTTTPYTPPVYTTSPPSYSTNPPTLPSYSSPPSSIASPTCGVSSPTPQLGPTGSPLASLSAGTGTQPPSSSGPSIGPTIVPTPLTGPTATVPAGPSGAGTAPHITPCEVARSPGGGFAAVLAGSASRFFLPSIFFLGLAGLTCGPALQYFARRRRVGGPAGARVASTSVPEGPE